MSVAIHYGYYIFDTDLVQWLDTARCAMISKNKVRKDLWSNLQECIRTYLPPSENRNHFIRIPRSDYVSLHSLCLMDGKGADILTNDQILNFVTTIDNLTTLLMQHDRRVAQLEETEFERLQARTRAADVNLSQVTEVPPVVNPTVVASGPLDTSVAE